MKYTCKASAQKCRFKKRYDHIGLTLCSAPDETECLGKGSSAERIAEMKIVAEVTNEDIEEAVI